MFIMSFKIIRDDITKVKADAIVNTANPKPRIGTGTDHAVNLSAGPQLMEARNKIGVIQPGEVAVTPAFNLNAKYVIHAVGPVWQGGTNGEEAVLQRAYVNALEAAVARHCESVAFPLMATGTNGFPKEKGLSIAIMTLTSFCLSHDIQVYLVVFDDAVFDLAKRIFDNVQSFVDKDYVDTLYEREYSIQGCSASYHDLSERVSSLPEWNADAEKGTRVKRILNQPDISFHTMLFQLIEATGKKDSDVYSRAEFTRQQFSQKIRSNPSYHPSKNAAIRLAIGLQLDYENTQSFLKKVGYFLSEELPADKIVADFIRRSQHSVTDINLELYKKNLELLTKSRE